MAFRVLAFLAGVMLALGIGPSTVLGQQPVTPDPRVRDERTTDGKYPTGIELEVRDSETTWGPNAIRDCWARMLFIEFGLPEAVFESFDPDHTETIERKRQERDEEWRLSLEAKDQEPKPPDSCLTHTAESASRSVSS